MSKTGNGVYLAVFKKAPKMAKKWIITRNKLVIDWEILKADLESLSKPQLELVLELVEHIKKVNEEDEEGVTSKRVVE